MTHIYSVNDYLQTIWSRRFFLLSLVKLDLEMRYRRSILGIGWSLLQPIAMTTVLCFVFYKIFKLDLKEFASYVFTGVLVWNHISASVTEGCQSILSAEKYMRSYPLPLALYPLRTAIGVAIHFMLLLVVTLIVTWVFRGFGNVYALPTLIPSFMLLFIFTWSMSVVFGMINVYFTDTQHLAGIALQLLFYLTPVFYPPEMFRNRGLFSEVLRYNPLGHFVELIRSPILHGRMPTEINFAYAGTTVLVTFILAVFLLARNERKLIYSM